MSEINSFKRLYKRKNWGSSTGAVLNTDIKIKTLLKRDIDITDSSSVADGEKNVIKETWLRICVACYIQKIPILTRLAAQLGSHHADLPLIQLLFSIGGIIIELQRANMLLERHNRGKKNHGLHLKLWGEGTWFLGLWWWSGVHLRISAKAVQVAFDCLQGIIAALFSCLSTEQ